MKSRQRGRKHSGRRASSRSGRSPKPIERTEEISIRALASGGDGVGRLEDGRVVFVRLTAPGDRVRISYSETGGRFVRAKSVEVLEPGPDRVAPECRVFGRCGGCSWQHIAYPAQLAAKHEILRSAMSRIGGLPELPEIQMIACKSPFGYRGRTRLLVAGSRVGYRRWHSNEIEPIDSCPILLPALDSALASLATQLREQPEASGPGGEWEIAVGSDGTVRSLPLAGSREEFAKVVLEVAGERVSISPGGFSQGNALVLNVLYELVSEALDMSSGGFLLELYAGAGFFTLALARRFDRVIAIECDEVATADLVHNLRESGQSNVEVRTARVEEALSTCEGERPDAVLLDPPRAGLAPGAASAIARLRPGRIVYVSCDAATLARDLGIFAGGESEGTPPYEVAKLTGLDLFPQTAHVEAVALLLPAK